MNQSNPASKKKINLRCARKQGITSTAHWKRLSFIPALVGPKLRRKVMVGTKPENIISVPTPTF